MSNSFKLWQDCYYFLLIKPVFLHRSPFSLTSGVHVGCPNESKMADLCWCTSAPLVVSAVWTVEVNVMQTRKAISRPLSPLATKASFIARPSKQASGACWEEYVCMYVGAAGLGFYDGTRQTNINTLWSISNVVLVKAGWSERSWFRLVHLEHFLKMFREIDRENKSSIVK